MVRMSGPFRVLWLATASANLGDGVVLTALPLIALAAGASAAEVALVATVATVAWPFVGLHAGWVVDRVSVGRLLLTANVMRAGALALLAWAIVADVTALPAVFAAALVYGVAETVVDTAITASVPRLVTAPQFTGANSRLEATANTLNAFAGPPLAGALVSVSAVLAAATGSALYAVTALGCVFLLRTLGRPTQREPHKPSTDQGRVRDGLVFLWRHPVLRPLTAFTATMNLVWSAWLAVFVVYAVDPGPLGLSPVGYGWLIAAMSIGGIAAAILIPLLRRVVSIPTLLFADLVGTVLLVLPAAIDAPLWAIASGIVLAGAGSSVWRILVAVIRQEQTPSALLGRAYSASRVISWGALPIGSALAAVLANWTGVQSVLTAASILAAGTAASFPLLRMRTRMAAMKAPGDV